MFKPLAVTVLIIAAAAPAAARPAATTRLLRICDDAGRCRHVTIAHIRRALLPLTARTGQPAAAFADAATNRRQLNALLAKLR